MKDNWQSSLEEILHHEGGYVNHPRDPGGETNLGVTKRVYEEWGGEKDMRDLTREDVEPIYKQNYWDKHSKEIKNFKLSLIIFKSWESPTILFLDFINGKFVLEIFLNLNIIFLIFLKLLKKSK